MTQSLKREIWVSNILSRMDELRLLAAKKSDEDLLHFFPDELARQWVSHSGPERVLQRMQQCERTLEELRTMEKKADANVLLKLFESGELCVRGYDKHGRPIMWGQPTKNLLNLRPPYTEASLYHMWFLILNCRRRKHPEVPRKIVFNYFDSKLLEFNFQLTREICRLCAGFGSDMLNRDSIIFLPNPLFAYTSNLLINFFKPIRVTENPPLLIWTNREEWLNELRDPSDIPGTFLPSGRKFKLSFETSGNWRDLVEKNAFENMTLKDIFFPDPDEFEFLRRRVEEEENQLLSPAPRSPCEQGALSGESRSEEDDSDGSEYESTAGDSEFLM